MRGRGRGARVQPCAPIRELEWPLVWNNQPLNIPIFWRLRGKTYCIQVTPSELGAQVKHAYVNFLCADQKSTWRPISATSPGSLCMCPRPKKTQKNNKGLRPRPWLKKGAKSLLLLPFLLLLLRLTLFFFLYDTGLKKPRLPDINPSYFTVEGDVNRTLAVRAAVRPHRSHSHYTPTPRRCKSFVLEANAWSPASKGSQPQIINILPPTDVLPRYR